MATFPLDPYFRRMMIGLRQFLYSVVTDGYVYGLCVPLPQPFFLFKEFMYLFDRDRDSQREKDHMQGE